MSIWRKGWACSPQAAAPFIYGGNNFAFADEQTGTFPALPADQIAGILAQVGGIWAPSLTAPVDANALFVVVAGGNDLRDARSLFSSNSAADIAGRQQAAINAFTNLANTLGLLASLGAKNVLVATLPDLGITPEAALVNAVAASTDATNRFNALVPQAAGRGYKLWFKHEPAGYQWFDQRHSGQPGALWHYRHQQPLLRLGVQCRQRLLAIRVFRHPALFRLGSRADWP